MYQPIGKIKLIREGAVPLKMDLWAAGSTTRQGRLRVRDVLQALEWDTMMYLDEHDCEVHICEYERGPLKGFSTDVFEPGQVLNVIGRKLEEQGISDMKIDGYNDSDVKTCYLEDCEYFMRLSSLVDEVRKTSSEIKEKLESISSLSLA